jgi:hypothetical protein
VGVDIEVGLGSMQLNAEASTVPKWRKFKLVRGTTFEPTDGFG